MLVSSAQTGKRGSPEYTPIPAAIQTRSSLGKVPFATSGHQENGHACCTDTARALIWDICAAILGKLAI